MIVAGMLRRNRKITSTTSPTASDSSNSTSSTEARMVVVRSVSGVTVTDAGSEAVICRQQLLDAVDHLDDIGAGLALDVDDDRRRARSSRPTSLVFSAPCSTVATSDELDRRAIAVGDHRVAVFAGLWIWSLALIEKDCEGPSKLPLGVLTLRLVIVVRRSSRLRP